MREENIKKAVRDGYAKIAEAGSCCCTSVANCCGQTDLAKEISLNIGYSNEDLKNVPEGSNLGLGCGNPTALASLKSGETVIDLGSGAGFDCFLAADKVGSKGKIIGIDMTPEMIDKARENARKDNITNVEFRIGEIENLPVTDCTADVIISNCVINLSPDKEKVFKEANRVLKPGGRIMVSDIVLEKQLPESIRNNISAYISCISGAILKDDYLNIIKKAGFTDIKILEESIYPVNNIISDDSAAIMKNSKDLSRDGNINIENSVLSIKVSAIKK
jgi:SAM-dependent methyltransferase